MRHYLMSESFEIARLLIWLTPLKKGDYKDYSDR